MSMQTYKINNWMWVGYPVGVIIFIILSFNYLVNNQAALQKLTVKKDEAQAQQKIAEELKVKLEHLKQIDTQTETERLKKFLVAVPASRQIWKLVTELNNSASVSGAIIEEYRGAIGDVKEASESATPPAVDDETAKMTLKVKYDTGEFDPLYKVLASLEGAMPLVKVSKIVYQNKGAEVTVEGAWAQWVKISQDSGTPLPNYQNLSAKVETALSELIPVE